MNPENIRKMEIFVIICLLLVGVLTFFSYPGITGHVSTELSTQQIDIMVNRGQMFELTTDSANSFYINSFRISGSVVGEGIAEAYLDNGQGQKLLVFTNIRDKQKGMTGLTGITAKVVGSDTNFKEISSEKVLILRPGEYADEKPLSTLNREQEVYSGGFEGECLNTCFIEMEMSSKLAYNLIFRVEEGTQIHLTKIQYLVKGE